MARKTNQVTRSGAVMLDPGNVGSSIRWRSTFYRRNKRVISESEVMLTDCDRQIKWCGWGPDADLLISRIDKAIEALTSARNDIAQSAQDFLKKHEKGKALT